jgi:hypothetical protein
MIDATLEISAYTIYNYNHNINLLKEDDLARKKSKYHVNKIPSSLNSKYILPKQPDSINPCGK